MKKSHTLIQWVIILALFPMSLLHSQAAASASQQACPDTQFETGSIPDNLLGWACKAATWLKSGVKGFRSIAKDEDRQRVARAARRFADDILAIERDKRALLQSLRRASPNESDISAAANDLKASVTDAQNTLNTRLSPLLLAEYKAGGSAVENLLNSALSDRKAWVSNVLEARTLDSQERKRFIAAGDSALTALRSAQLAARALADSVESLIR